MYRYTVNASILLTECAELAERPDAVKRAGFDAVEFWWPFPRPFRRTATSMHSSRPCDGAGVQLTGLNFSRVTWPAETAGSSSWKSRAGEFVDNLDVVVGIGERLGCRAFNALYGLRNDECTAAEADALAGRESGPRRPGGAARSTESSSSNRFRGPTPTP